MLKHLASSVLLISLITLPRTTNAQSAQRLEIDIPFSFVLAGRSLSAGKYVVERTDPTRPNILTLTNVDNGIVRLVLTQRVEKDNPGTASSLVFMQRGGKRYLFQVWNFGAVNGSQIPVLDDKHTSNQRHKERTLVILRTIH